MFLILQNYGNMRKYVLYSLLGGTLFMLSSCAGTRPTNLGIQNGQLIDCPNSPNCVNTLSDTKKAKIEAIAFEGDWQSAKQKLVKVIEDYPRTTIVKDDGKYLYVEFKTGMGGFVDDVEFILDDQAKQIHFRSASRLGYSDVGANRRRMEKVRKLFVGK